jgi:thymidylate synthase
MTSFDNWYQEIVRLVMEEGVEEHNQRTGYNIRAITGVSQSFRPAQEFPLLTLRKTPLKLFIAEIIWYLQGDKKLDFFQKFSRIWDDFKDEMDENTVETSYGYRWRGFFGRDQVQGLLKLLEKDPSSRHGVVVTWDPGSDGLDGAKKKNVPCVPVWVANIVGGELNIHFLFRSQDVMLGLPHDVAGFALLQMILAQRLGVRPGYLHYTGSHVHIYENHFEQAKIIAGRESLHPPVSLSLPENTYQRAMAKEESLVLEIFEQLNNQYQPLPSVGKMQIAL